MSFMRNVSIKTPLGTTKKTIAPQNQLSGVKVRHIKSGKFIAPHRLARTK